MVKRTVFVAADENVLDRVGGGVRRCASRQSRRSKCCRLPQKVPAASGPVVSHPSSPSLNIWLNNASSESIAAAQSVATWQPVVEVTVDRLLTRTAQ
jgi:hypothetical protein